MKFKVGDKIIVTDEFPISTTRGMKGEVLRAYDNPMYPTEYPYDIKFSDGSVRALKEEELDFDPAFIFTEYLTVDFSQVEGEDGAWPNEQPTSLGKLLDAYPDDNPKTAIGVTKVPLHLVPPSAKHFLAAAFADGAKKYGPYNWRDKTVSSSVYLGAAQRHMDAWWDGEQLSSDARVHHLAHAMACLAIVLDAETVGKLNDDRPTKGAVSQLQAQWGQP